jgi:hypothetical protein
MNAKRVGIADAEVRAMDAFVEQAGRLQETLSSFCERGGFCREHAWLFHRRAALSLTGVPVAQMYEALLRRDIAHLDRLELNVAKAHARRRPESLLGRRACLPCERAQERLQAKSKSLVRALAVTSTASTRGLPAQVPSSCHARGRARARSAGTTAGSRSRTPPSSGSGR